MALDTRAHVGIAATQTAALDLASASAPIASDRNLILTNGTGANQADRIYSDQNTLGASATVDLDLAGTLTDAFGATVTFARIKFIMVTAAAGNTNNVVIGAAATNQFVNWVGAGTHTVAVRPGGVFCIGATDATAYAVTAGTGDLLRIANSAAGSSVTYDIVIVGCSA